MKANIKQGLAPGTMVFTGTQKVEALSFELIQYNETELTSQTLDTKKNPELNPETVNWLNVTGLHDTHAIENLGKHFNLHPLTLEDLVSVGQRPKVEAFDDYLFITLRMLSLKNDKLDNEQLSIILKDNTVITFQERSGDVFAPLRDRLSKAKGRIRKLKADYLAYALMDVTVDHYFAVLEHYSDQIETLEQVILESPTPKALEQVNQLKRELLFFKKSVWPLRELINALIREESGLLSQDVQAFLRDLHDHAIQVIDSVETLREMLTGLHDFYLSSLSNKMNEVMKVLTIISTIFIPLGFLAGVYGMNFEHIAELQWRWAYPTFWLVILSLVTLMLLYFKRRDWL